MQRINLIDVSGWQWPSRCDPVTLRIADQVRGCYAKTSQGVKPMRSFRKHQKRFRGYNDSPAGVMLPIAFGGYHYADLRWGKKSLASAKRQAEIFVKTLGPLKPGDLPPALDLEWQSYPGGTKDEKKLARGKDLGARAAKFPASQVLAWALTFLERVEELTGITPVLYTGRSFWHYRLARTKRLARYPIWQAAYVALDNLFGPPEHNPPVSMAEAGTLHIWQYTGKGKCYGYRNGAGKIDRDLFIGSEADFATFLVQPKGEA